MTSRNTLNQRLARARRKSYIAQLETRLRAYEVEGVRATAEVQRAARRVADENRFLRKVLCERFGVCFSGDGLVGGGTGEEWNCLNLGGGKVGAGVKGQAGAGAGAGADNGVGVEADGTLQRERERRKPVEEEDGAGDENENADGRPRCKQLTRTRKRKRPFFRDELPLYNQQTQPHTSSSTTSSQIDALYQHHHHPSQDQTPEETDPARKPNKLGTDKRLPKASPSSTSPSHCVALHSVNTTSCEEAALIIASMRGLQPQQTFEVLSELGCHPSSSCTVDNMRLFGILDAGNAAGMGGG